MGGRWPAPLGAAAALALLLLILPNPKAQLFSLHPILMTAAYAALPSLALAKKKIPGRPNTILHILLMCTALLSALVAHFAIFEHKTKLGKPHNKTWHSWCGLASTLAFAVMCAASLPLLHPDFGVQKTSKRLRTMHRFGGRLVLSLCHLTMVTGVATLSGYAGTSVALALVAMSWHQWLIPDQFSSWVYSARGYTYAYGDGVV